MIMCISKIIPSFVRQFGTVLEYTSLTQSIALDIIFYRNIVISKSWHYAEAYKTDKSIIRKNNIF